MGNFAENLNLGNRFRPPLPNSKCTKMQASGISVSLCLSGHVDESETAHTPPHTHPHPHIPHTHPHPPPSHTHTQKVNIRDFQVY